MQQMSLDTLFKVQVIESSESGYNIYDKKFCETRKILLDHYEAYQAQSLP